MSASPQSPVPLSIKPDLEDAARRWEAFYAGEIIDRPIVCVTAPRKGMRSARGSDYRERAFGDLDDIIDRALLSAQATYYGGEAIPSFWLSFSPDEIAVFCGAELGWSDDSGDTNWSKPVVEDWDDALPIRLKPDHPLWSRMLDFYRKAADRLQGRMLLAPLDLHTNMDLLAALRGPQRLCLDLIDQPEAIDRAMESARALFRDFWDAIRTAGRMDENGYCQVLYSMEGAAFLQCDFSCMMGPEMFRRWVLPALEEEAEIAKHVVYHWDGPEALTHFEDLVASRGLHALSYVPGAGAGEPVEYIDLYRRIHEKGKATHVWGTPDEVKRMHKELRPEKMLYCTYASDEEEADRLLDWFVQNT